MNDENFKVDLEYSKSLDIYTLSYYETNKNISFEYQTLTFTYELNCEYLKVFSKYFEL